MGYGREGGREGGEGVPMRLLSDNKQDTKTTGEHNEHASVDLERLTSHGSDDMEFLLYHFFEINDIRLEYLQGCAVSRYRFGRTWIETFFWFCIWFAEPVFGYRSCIRYFFLTVGDTLVALQNLEPVSGPGLAIQNSCIEHNLGCHLNTPQG